MHFDLTHSTSFYPVTLCRQSLISVCGVFFYLASTPSQMIKINLEKNHSEIWISVCIGGESGITRLAYIHTLAITSMTPSGQAFYSYSAILGTTSYLASRPLSSGSAKLKHSQWLNHFLLSCFHHIKLSFLHLSTSPWFLLHPMLTLHSSLPTLSHHSVHLQRSPCVSLASTLPLPYRNPSLQPTFSKQSLPFLPWIILHTLLDNRPVFCVDLYSLRLSAVWVDAPVSIGE